ncbi:MAG: hypothetical protein LAO03_14000 [Acidobacteriia bacterium]|nr:hypothetical protein [Terriglobia bacterium]
MSAQVYNACWLILALIPSALWLRGYAANDRRTCRRLLGLFAALGVLGFVFSVVSPDDDSTQQEFTQSQKASAQILVKNATRDGTRIPAQYVFSPRALAAFSKQLIAPARAARTDTSELILIQVAADSSPPLDSLL